MTVPTPPPNPPRRNILRKKHVMQRLQVSDVTIWNWVNRGIFPAPFQFNPGLRNSPIGWFEDEIDEWLANRAQVRGFSQQHLHLLYTRWWLGPTASGMYRTRLPNGRIVPAPTAGAPIAAD